jgi:hypothetical protein
VVTDGLQPGDVIALRDPSKTADEMVATPPAGQRAGVGRAPPEGRRGGRDR